ncbi:MAG: acyloxyacyl hydrolase [Luteolibacter sp.]|uniref:acyloxyacyl hydrolase n=1 Tax=Luteolibacter sp. TaxID=1962973 RepID=UPI003265BF36
MFTPKMISKPLVVLAALLIEPRCFAVTTLIDSMAFESGIAEKVEMARVSVQSDWNCSWFEQTNTHLSGYWDANLALLRGDAYQDQPDKHQNIAVLNLTPVFRYERMDKKGWYCEAGVGASFFFDLYDNNGDQLSTHFEFADHFGIGYVFDNRWELGAKVQHYSNGGFKKPNDGITWLVLKVGYHF